MKCPSGRDCGARGTLADELARIPLITNFP
jgi:hypothetical protein